MKEKLFPKFLAFLEQLDQAKMSYHLEHSRENALMVIVCIPGEYWEIEFLEDGEIEIERYRSNGKIQDETLLNELFLLWSEEKPAPKKARKANDLIARK